MPETICVFVTIGNTDNKLSQLDWAEFCGKTDEVVREHALQMWGEFYALSNAPWQNACWSFDIDIQDVEAAQADLRALAADFEQDSILWSKAENTFLDSAS